MRRTALPHDDCSGLDRVSGPPTARGRASALYRISPADLEDLAQEVRIALWEVGDRDVSTAWVMRVASNKAVNLIRSRTRALARNQTFGCLAAKRLPEPGVDLLLSASIAELPAPLRGFYELHYLQGLSEREIASLLGKCRPEARRAPAGREAQPREHPAVGNLSPDDELLNPSGLRRVDRGRDRKETPPLKTFQLQRTRIAGCE